MKPNFWQQKMEKLLHTEDPYLKKILSDIFPNKKIVIQNKNDGSQTIFLS